MREVGLELRVFKDLEDFLEHPEVMGPRFVFVLSLPSSSVRHVHSRGGVLFFFDSCFSTSNPGSHWTSWCRWSPGAPGPAGNARRKRNRWYSRSQGRQSESVTLFPDLSK